MVAASEAGLDDCEGVEDDEAARKGWCKTDGKHSESQSATNCYLQPGAAGEVETKVQIAYGKEGTEGGGFGDGKGPL